MPQDLNQAIRVVLGNKYRKDGSYRLCKPKEQINFTAKGWSAVGKLDGVDASGDLIIMEKQP